MTTKMLIVDDEPVICEGLRNTIDWEELDVEVIGVAYDGEQAVQIINENQVDLILTDVCMPEMDGLALTEYVISEYPHTKIIMISGYDEFKYARQALRLGVEDYLLKPVDIDELMGLIKKTKEEILKEKEEQIKKEEFIISQWVLHYLLNAPLSSEVKENGLQRTNHYRIVVSEIADYQHLINNKPNDQIDGLKKIWKGHVNEVLMKYGIRHISLFDHENELFTICYCEDERLLDDKLMESICYEIDENWEYPLRFAISSPHNELTEIPNLYKEVNTVLSEFRGKKETALFTDQFTQKHKQVIYPKEWETTLRSAILNLDMEEVEKLVKEAFKAFRKQEASLEQALDFCQEMMKVTKKSILDVVDSKEVDKLEIKILQYVDVKIYNTYAVLQNTLLEDMRLIAKVIEEKSNKNHWIIEKAKQYIRENYRKEIKASKIAEDHFITPNYFSVIFKQETGVSFSEYLNSLRIEKASDLLLNTANKVFEIAEYVGYKEYKYFVQVFKKHKGVTPTHYRKLNATKVK